MEIKHKNPAKGSSNKSEHQNADLEKNKHKENLRDQVTEIVNEFVKSNTLTREDAVNSLTQLQISKNLALRVEKISPSIYCVALMEPSIFINEQKFLLAKVGLTQLEASEIRNSPRLQTVIKKILGALVQLGTESADKGALKKAKAQAWANWQQGGAPSVINCQVWPVSRTDTMPLLDIEENIRFRVGIPIPKKLVRALPVPTEWVLTLESAYKQTRLAQGDTTVVPKELEPTLSALSLTDAWKPVHEARLANGKDGYTKYDKVYSALKKFEKSVETRLDGALANLQCPDALKPSTKSPTPQ